MYVHLEDLVDEEKPEGGVVKNDYGVWLTNTVMALNSYSIACIQRPVSSAQDCYPRRAELRNLS